MKKTPFEIMEIFAKTLSVAVNTAELSEALALRSQMLGQLTEFGPSTEHDANKEHQDIVDTNPELPEWKIRVIWENTMPYRTEAFRKRLVKTIEIQTQNIRSQMIERQSERKLSR